MKLMLNIFYRLESRIAEQNTKILLLDCVCVWFGRSITTLLIRITLIVTVFFSIKSSPVSIDSVHIQSAVPDSVHIQYDVPDSVQIQYAVPDSVHIQYAIPDSVHIQFAVPDSVHIQSAVPDSVHTQYAVPDSAYIQPSVPDSVHIQSALRNRKYSQRCHIYIYFMQTFDRNKISHA